MGTAAYALGHVLGIACGVVLPSVVASYVISRHTGAWTLTLFGTILLVVALCVCIVTVLSDRRGHDNVA